MDFTLSEDQELIVESFRDLMEKENWEPYFLECDEKHEYPLRWVKELCDLGFDRIMLPEEHGGLGLDQTSYLYCKFHKTCPCLMPPCVLYPLGFFNFSSLALQISNIIELCSSYSTFANNFYSINSW